MASFQALSHSATAHPARLSRPVASEDIASSYGESDFFEEDMFSSEDEFMNGSEGMTLSPSAAENDLNKYKQKKNRALRMFRKVFGCMLAMAVVAFVAMFAFGMWKEQPGVAVTAPAAKVDKAVSAIEGNASGKIGEKPLTEMPRAEEATKSCCACCKSENTCCIASAVAAGTVVIGGALTAGLCCAGGHEPEEEEGEESEVLPEESEVVAYEQQESEVAYEQESEKFSDETCPRTD